MAEAEGKGVSPSLTVDDLAASVEWYTKVLGFTEDERWEHEGRLAGISLAFGDTLWYLTQDDWKLGRDRQKGAGWRLHVEVEGDLDAYAAGIELRGGTLASRPQDQSWGVRDFSVVDPTGFKITFAKELA
jgi:uncharacterized glyoxalase superfamily protein PhnB